MMYLQGTRQREGYQVAMNKKINESRRGVLKKLGLTTGAAYVVPAVTALVVPQHATATSSSVLTTSGIVVFRYHLSFPEPKVLTIGIDTAVLTSVTSGTVVQAFGHTIPYVASSLTTLFFKKLIDPAPYTADGTYQVTIGGTTYSATGTYIL